MHSYPAINELIGAKVYVKHENYQPVGAFKVRGGINLISQLSDKEKILFRFIVKVNHHSIDIAATDMRLLREAGWSDDAIYYAITVCALFNFYNRWVDACGVHEMSDEAHLRAAKRSVVHGYVRTQDPFSEESPLPR